MTETYTREDLITYLQALAEDLGQSPTAADVKQREDAPPFTQFLAVFDSWNKAKEAADLETFRKAGRGEPYSDTELLELLRQLAADQERTVTLRDMEDADDYPSAVTYQRRFDSWNNAKAQAGLDTIAEDDTAPGYTDEELLDILRELAAARDRPLTKRDVADAEDCPDPTTFERRFGSWNTAKKQAGLETLGKGEGSRQKMYSDDELLDHLRQRASEVSGNLTEAAMDAAPDYPSVSTYRDRFGSWTQAKNAAGLDP